MIHTLRKLKMIKKELFAIAIVLSFLTSFVATLRWLDKQGDKAQTEHYEVVLPKQYEAWRKHTGNPGNLTFEEWKYLPKHYK